VCLQCVAMCCTVLQCALRTPDESIVCHNDELLLQYTVLCCSESQCVAMCCSVLQCVAVCCTVLHCVALCCSVLQCIAVCCSVLQCVAVCCSELQCVAVCCSMFAMRETDTGIMTGSLNLVPAKTFWSPFCIFSIFASRSASGSMSVLFSTTNKWFINISPTTCMCVAVCCSVLRCVAVCCSVLQCVAE